MPANSAWKRLRRWRKGGWAFAYLTYGLQGCGFGAPVRAGLKAQSHELTRFFETGPSGMRIEVRCEEFQVRDLAHVEHFLKLARSPLPWVQIPVVKPSTSLEKPTKPGDLVSLPRYFFSINPDRYL